MSALSVKAAARHPARKASRVSFDVAHFCVEVCDDPEIGVTFGLKTGCAAQGKSPALFSGFVEKGMAAELRALADHIEPLEGKL